MEYLCSIDPIMRLGEAYGKVLSIPVRDDCREMEKGTLVYCAKARRIPPSSGLKKNFNVSKNS